HLRPIAHVPITWSQRASNRLPDEDIAWVKKLADAVAGCSKLRVIGPAQPIDPCESAEIAVLAGKIDLAVRPLKYAVGLAEGPARADSANQVDRAGIRHTREMECERFISNDREEAADGVE